MSSTITALTSGGGLAMAGDTSGQLQLQTNNGTTAVTVDTSQNVGIGNTTPSDYKLVVDGEGSTGGFALKRTGTLTGSGSLRLVGSSGSEALAFGVNATERMRITSTGALCFGTTTPYDVGVPATINASVTNLVLAVTNGGATPYGQKVVYTSASPNSSGYEFFRCDDSTTTRMTVRSNGGLANYSANNVNLSDQREKKDIELAGNYLDKVCAIPVKTFLFNDQTDTDLNLGVIAQEVQSIAPELVSESNWGTKEEPKMRLSIYQTDLQYALMKAIQELNAKVDAQALEIQALKGVA